MEIETLQKDIERIRAEKAEAEERIHLYSLRGRGRGRGRGFGPGRGQQDRRKYGDREERRGYGDKEDAGQENEKAEAAAPGDPGAGLSSSLQARLGKRPSGGGFLGNRDEHDHRVGRASWKRQRDNAYDQDRLENEFRAQEPLPGSNTGRLASAIVVDNAAQEEEEPGIARRPTENGAGNPEVKKRNKRLFGSLLGTLQKFQEEDQRFKRSRLAQNRAEAEQRAVEKAAVEEQRMREKHKQDLARARVEEINKSKQLDLELQAKEYEVLVTSNLAKEMKLGAWLKTAAQPGVLWLPKHHTAETALLLEQRAIDMDAWKEAQLQKIEKTKDQILARYRPVPQPLVKPSRLDQREHNGDVQMADAPQNPAQAEEDVQRFEAEEPFDIKPDTEAIEEESKLDAVKMEDDTEDA